MKLVKNVDISKELQYHIENNIPLSENVFRTYSDKFFSLINEVRELYDKNKIRLTENDIWVVESDLGKKVILENGQEVWLDIPVEDTEPINEAEYQGKDVKLNYPMRGGTKKYHVFVKNPKTGNVKKIAFGDVHGGLTAKISNPQARKSFAARHNCKDKKDKTKAGYWACRLTKFGHLFGNKTYSGYW